MKKILIVNLGGLGDMLFSVPFMKGLRKKYPEAKLTLLTVTHSYDIISTQHLFDEIVELPASTSDIRSGRVFKYLGKLFSLRKEKYDLAVNLRTIVTFLSGLKMALMMFILGAKKNAGRNSEGFGFFYDIRVSEKKIYKKHELDYHAKLAELLGFTIKGKPEVKLLQKHKAFARSYFSFNKIKTGEKLILMNIESRWQAKRWPLKYYVELIEKLLIMKNFRIGIIFYKDVAVAEVIKKMFKKVLLLRDENLLNVSAVLARANLLISNDTGIIHVGAALNIKTVGLYGSSDPFLTGPLLPESNKVVFYKGVRCSPCNKLECTSMECFKKITVNAVLTAVKKLLKQR